MADLTDAQRKRAEARKQRRKPDDKDGDAGAGDAAPEQQPEQEPEQADSHHAVRQAAKVAAAAGAAGAVAAAARALANHQDHQDDEDDHQGRAPQQEEAEQPEEPQPEERQQEEQQQEDEQPEPEAGERDGDPVDGASAGDARRALDRGRSQLEDLLGRPVESVSALERTHDGWVLGLEVVEVRRIPETTDVLGSYELELDDGLDLRRYQQVRRYHRAQAERERGESA